MSANGINIPNMYVPHLAVQADAPVLVLVLGFRVSVETTLQQGFQCWKSWYAIRLQCRGHRKAAQTQNSFPVEPAMQFTECDTEMSRCGSGCARHGQWPPYPQLSDAPIFIKIGSKL